MSKGRGWFAGLLAVVGPGIFMIGYNIGTGSVTTMAVAGAEYGMSLLWPLVFACGFTGVMLMAFGKYTAITGETSIYAIRRHFHPALALFLVVGLTANMIGSIMGVMALCAEATSEWIAILLPQMPHIPTLVPALIYCLLIYVLFLRGRYAVFEKFLAVMVGLMGVCFFLSMLLVIPDPLEVLRGMAPGIPTQGNAALIIAGMAGTTLAPVVIVARSHIIKQKGWGVAELATQQRDAIVAAILIFVIGASVMACAAGTMYVQGVTIDSAIDMMQTLAPIAGSLAASVFVFGFLAAGLSSQFPNAIFIPWLIRDYRNEELSRLTGKFKLLMAACVAIGLVVPIFGGRPIIVMIASQALNTFNMPLLTFCIWRLLNRPEVVGEHVNSRMFNVAILVTLVFALCMSVLSFIGLRELFGM